MKRLICAKEVEALAQQGQKVMYIDADTLITPSARDAASAEGIEFCTEAPKAECCSTSQDTHACNPTNEGIDSEVIYNALKTLMDKGMLGSVMNSIGQDVPYVSENDGSGLVKLVRSNTAKWEPLDTGNPANKVFYNELIGADDGSAMNAGFMTIENCSFPWDVACQEIYYVVEGTLTVEKDGKVFTANPGDCMFFQNGAKLTFGSTNKVKVFYATH
ncbi:MAG: cupin domain-containing protein [Anaerovoracaceae bacterium]